MAKRIILIVIGALLILVGVGSALGGGALIALFGTDGKASSATDRIGTSQVALVAAIDDIKDTHGFATVVGRPTLQLSAANQTRPVFIGIGPASAVERYLANAPIDRVTDFDVDPFRLTTEPRAGTARPAPPGEQSFWTVRADGTNATVDWKITDGSYRLVVMNADASPNVAATSAVALTIPHLFGIALGALIGGVVLALVGILLVILGARTRPDRAPPRGPVGQPLSV